MIGEIEETGEYEEESYEKEFNEESENEEIDNCECNSFGSMDIRRAFNRFMGFSNRCVDCECYNECHEATYGKSEETKTSLKAEDDEQHIQKFFSNLPKQKLSVDFSFSKPRKIVKVGQLSHGVTIPKILNQIYSRGSEVLTYWSSESKVLLFFGEGSFISEGNREILVNLYLKGYTTFRNVVFVGKLNVVVIPRQFMQYFNADRKVNPQFDSSANVLFFRSNLSDLELDELRRQKQAKSYITHTAISKTDSKILGYKDSEEYKQREKMRRELF